MADGLSSLVKKDENIKKIFLEILRDKEENKWVRGMIAYDLYSLVNEDADIKKIFVRILKDKNESEGLKEIIIGLTQDKQEFLDF